MTEAVTNVPTQVFATPEDLGTALAREILDAAAQARRAGRAYILGAPGGRSLRPTYQALAELAREDNADLSHLVVVMPDEYLKESASGFTCVSPDTGYSCRGFGQRVILQPLQAAVGAARAPAADALWLPDAHEPEAFDQQLEAAGGIDLFLVASGSFDGHVAFNAPGAALDSGSRIVELPEALLSRRRFMASETVEDHPTHGVTIGLKTISAHSRSTVLVCNGTEKQQTVSRVQSEGRFTSDWPATLIFECRRPRIWVDAEAAA